MLPSGARERKRREERGEREKEEEREREEGRKPASFLFSSGHSRYQIRSRNGRTHFFLITCFLHRRFFPKGEVLRGLPITEGCPRKPGTVCARSDQGSVNDGTVPAVSVLRQQTPVLSPVSLGTLSVEPEVVMSPGALTGDMPAVPVQCLQEAAAAQLRGARV